MLSLSETGKIMLTRENSGVRNIDLIMGVNDNSADIWIPVASRYDDIIRNIHLVFVPSSWSKSSETLTSRVLGVRRSSFCYFHLT